MSISRRDFFDQLAEGGALAGLLPVLALAQGAASKPPETPHEKFWDQFFDATLAETRGAKNSGPPPTLAEPKRDVRFLFNSSEGLRYVDKLQKSDLLDHAGDVAVSVNLGQFRPGQGDQKDLKRLQSAQLRLDCVQTRPLMNLFAPLAWTALATLFTDSAGRLPSLQALGFDSGSGLSGANKIVLPGGLGKVAMNVSMVKRNSILHTVLQNLVKGTSILAPFLSFPAISVPALKTFTELYTYLEQHHSYLLNSNLTTAVATQQAWGDEDRPPAYLPLVTGDYVMVPYSHVDELSSSLEKVSLSQGYLVDKSASADQPVDKLKDLTARGVTYLSMRVTVSPLTTPLGPASEKSSADGAGDDSSASPSGKKSGGGGGQKPASPNPGGNPNPNPGQKKKKQ